MPAASPCDRARRSAADAGRAWSARSLPLRLAPRSNAAAGHNDRRIRMTLADHTVDIVPIVRPIAGKRRNRARNLLQQGTDLRAVIDILAGQLGGDDLSCVGVHPDVELSPGPTHLCGVLLDQPLTGTAELEPGAVHQQVDRFAACDVIGRPIRHSVPLLRDMMTAILVRFEWHGGCPGQKRGPDTPSNPRRLTTDPCNKVSS